MPFELIEFGYPVFIRRGFEQAAEIDAYPLTQGLDERLHQEVEAQGNAGETAPCENRLPGFRIGRDQASNQHRSNGDGGPPEVDKSLARQGPPIQAAP